MMIVLYLQEMLDFVNQLVHQQCLLPIENIYLVLVINMAFVNFIDIQMKGNLGSGEDVSIREKENVTGKEQESVIERDSVIEIERIGLVIYLHISNVIVSTTHMIIEIIIERGI